MDSKNEQPSVWAFHKSEIHKKRGAWIAALDFTSISRITYGVRDLNPLTQSVNPHAGASHQTQYQITI